MNMPPPPSVAVRVPRLIRCANSRRKASFALLIAGAVVASGTRAFAASEYFDTSTNAGLNAGTATWDAGVTSAWSTITAPTAGTALTIWTNGNDAFFQTGGINTVTVDGTVIANSVQQTASGTITTIGNTTGSTLQISTSTNNNSGTVASVLTINAPIQLTNSSANATTFGRVTVNGGTAPTILNGVISDGSSFSQTLRIFTSGTGTASLGGINTFSGGVQIYASGTTGSSLAVTNVAAFGSNAGILFGQSGSTANTILTMNLAGDGTVSKNIISAAGTSTGTTPVTASTTINSAGAGAVTFTGNMLFNATLGGTNNALYGSTGNLGLVLGGASTALNTFQTAVINSNGTTVTTLTKQDAGTWRLTGTNTYTGATSVTGGTLLINGNSNAATGNVTVVAGATLGGTGTIGGATTVTGILSVGASSGAGSTPGTLTFSNAGTALTLNGTTMMDINGNMGKAVTNGNDLVNVTTGALVYGGALNISLNGFTPANNSTYDLFDFANTGSQSGSFSSILVGDGTTFAGSLDYTTGILTITAAAVPEPSTWVGAVCLSAFGIASYLRRRRAA